MNKMTIWVAGITLAGCISAKLATPSESDVNRVQSKFPGYTLADLNRGKALYESHCDKCHGLKNPRSEPESEWREIVPKMVGKVNRKSQVLDAKAEEDILRYVITMSGAGKKS